MGFGLRLCLLVHEEEERERHRERHRRVCGLWRGAFRATRVRPERLCWSGTRPDAPSRPHYTDGVLAVPRWFGLLLAAGSPDFVGVAHRHRLHPEQILALPQRRGLVVIPATIACGRLVAAGSRLARRAVAVPAGGNAGSSCPHAGVPTREHTKSGGQARFFLDHMHDFQLDHTLTTPGVRHREAHKTHPEHGCAPHICVASRLWGHTCAAAGSSAAPGGERPLRAGLTCACCNGLNNMPTFNEHHLISPTVIDMRLPQTGLRALPGPHPPPRPTPAARVGSQTGNRDSGFGRPVRGTSLREKKSENPSKRAVCRVTGSHTDFFCQLFF